jgi:hypothetical protein
MSFGFRVCFTVPGEGSLASDEEFIPFVPKHTGFPMKLSSGTRGINIGKTDRFSVTGRPFETSESAQLAAEQVRVALLIRATRTRRGIDLGQQSLKGFSMSAYGKQYVADLLNVPVVQEDHLGITVFPDDPMPRFVRMNMKGLVSSPAQTLVDELSESIGHYKFKSKKAEDAADIYAISHFVQREAARFLLLFISLETLFEPAKRAKDAQDHVQSLIETTQKANISSDDRMEIVSALTFQKVKSIGQRGRELAAKLLPGEKYESMDAVAFFSHIYKLRNNMVHRGEVDPSAINAILGETDRFVSDLLKHHYVEP